MFCKFKLFLTKDNLVKILFFLISTFGLILVFYIVGCRDVQFGHISEVDVCEENQSVVEGLACEEVWAEGEDGTYYVEEDGGGPGGSGDSGYVVRPGTGTRGGYTPPGNRRRIKVNKLTIQLGRVNLLFVVDNSHSMQEELQAIANKFDSFLEQIRKVNYRIGIITTDWKMDDGNLITFSNGQKFLSNPDQIASVHRENIRYFREKIKVPVGSNDDERGIYAANRALDKAKSSGFFRQHSLLMVVFVSDEDERSYGGKRPEEFYGGRVEPLEDLDYPETFFRKANFQHNSIVTTVAHSIIVKPGDKSCARSSGGVEGRIYAQASNPSQSLLNQYGNIRKGYIGSVCASNYGVHLGKIAEYVDEMPPVILGCSAVPGSVHVQVNGNRKPFTVSGRNVKITGEVPFGAIAEIWFRCPNNQTI